MLLRRLTREVEARPFASLGCGGVGRARGGVVSKAVQLLPNRGARIPGLAGEFVIAAFGERGGGPYRCKHSVKRLAGGLPRRGAALLRQLAREASSAAVHEIARVERRAERGAIASVAGARGAFGKRGEALQEILQLSCRLAHVGGHDTAAA